MPQARYSGGTPSTPLAVVPGDTVENRSTVACRVCAQATYADDNAATLPPGGQYTVKTAGSIIAKGIRGSGHIVVIQGL